MGKTSASIWVKNKSVGVVSQFSRGKSLKQYRHLVLSGDKAVVFDDEIIDEQSVIDLIGGV